MKKKLNIEAFRDVVHHEYEQCGFHKHDLFCALLREFTFQNFFCPPLITWLLDNNADIRYRSYLPLRNTVWNNNFEFFIHIMEHENTIITKELIIEVESQIETTTDDSIKDYIAALRKEYF